MARGATLAVAEEFSPSPPPTPTNPRPALDRGRVIAGVHQEVAAHAGQDVPGALQVTGGFLDGDDVLDRGQADHRLCRHVTGRAARYVVENLRDVDGFGDVLEVLVQAFLGRLVVVRRHQQAGVGAGVLRVF